jgi:hypothetical protein
MNTLFYYKTRSTLLPDNQRRHDVRPATGSPKRRGGDRMALFGTPRERDGLGQ